MLIIVPLLLLILVAAIWAIVSGISTILSQRTAAPPDARKIPDIMSFLKKRRKPSPFPYDETRHRILHR